MKKRETHIIKEVSIFLILLILIMLILAVALYDFIPSNISIPEKIEYSADSQTTSIKQEIAYTNGGDSSADQPTEQELITSLKSYSIEASDLTVYEEKNLYNSGNSNPFDYAEETTTPTEQTENKSTNGGTTGESNTATNGTSQTTTTQNNNAGGTTNSTTTESTTSATEGTTTGTFFENPASK